MPQAAKAASALAFAVLAAVPSIAFPSGAAAQQGPRLTAEVDGVPVATSTESRPIRLVPRRQATLSVEVTNDTTKPLDIRIVRLEGKVVGLTFFAYDTAVGLTVAPGQTGSRRFVLDLGGLDGQATGLIPGAVKLLDADRHVVAEEAAVVDVRGSLRSVYGAFGIGVAFLTALSFLGALVGLARHRLPPNRWRRGLRFLTPGLGLGLLLNFTLSATRVFVPSAGRWLTIVVVSAAVLFGLGYLTPGPDTGEDDDEEEGLIALPGPPPEPELPAAPAWPELATPNGMEAIAPEAVEVLDPAAPVLELPAGSEDADDDQPAHGPAPPTVVVPPTPAEGP